MIAPMQSTSSALLWTPDEAAAAMRVSRATLYRLTQPHGPIPVLRLSSGTKVDRSLRRKYASKTPGPPRFVVRYRPSDVQQWIDNVAEGAAS